MQQGVIFDSSSSLSEMYWQWRRGELFGVIHDPKVPRERTSTFLPTVFEQATHAPAILEIGFVPGSEVASIRATVRITAGAIK
jgi:hypothetical protein